MEQDYFVQERVNLMVEMANKKVMQEIELIRNTVIQLENEIISLRRQASNGHSVKMEEPKLVVEEKPVEVQPIDTPIQQDVPKRAPETEGQPRFGKYTSEDVSMDKFFYFGGTK